MQTRPASEDAFAAIVGTQTYTDKKAGTSALAKTFIEFAKGPALDTVLGAYRGLALTARKQGKTVVIALEGQAQS